MLMDKIVKTNNKKRVVIEKMQQSELPLIIYGAGSYASDVMKFLNKYGIKVSMACVDAEYINESKPSVNGWNGVRVTTLDDVSSRYDNFNVVIGFSDYRKAYAQLENVSGVAEVFFIDAPGRLDFFDYQYIIDHLKDFEFTYDLLADQLSKDTFSAYINAKISGQPDSLYDLVNKDQYFPDLITFNSNEVFVDCGAYDGDTILEFVKRNGGYYKGIYAFEPDESNYIKLKKTIIENDIKHVQLLKLGCWHSKTTLKFSPSANMTSLICDTGEATVSVEAIDNVVDQEEVTFIKMDIEGSEISALRGAEKTIKSSKPKLAICVYHKPEDLITIPQYIKAIVPDYKFFLRQHQFISWDTVLYAIPP